MKNNLFRKLGIYGEETPDNVEEEIISMVNEGHEHGVLHETEAEMITNIFEFGDKEAKDIMTNRSNILAIDRSCARKNSTATISSGKTFIQRKHSRRCALASTPCAWVRRANTLTVTVISRTTNSLCSA